MTTLTEEEKPLFRSLDKIDMDLGETDRCFDVIRAVSFVSRYRDAYGRAGATATISETYVVIGAIGVAVEHDAVRHAMPLGDGEEVAVEIRLPIGARCVGRSIAELARAPDFPPRCVVVAAGTNGPLEVARGATTLASEARVLLVAPRADLGLTLAFFLRP